MHAIEPDAIIAEAEELVGLLEHCKMLSEKLGIPHISWDDGAALYALAFSLAAERGEVVAVDAGAGVGFSSLWILAALKSAGAKGRLVAIEAKRDRHAELTRILSSAPAKGVVAEAVLGDAVERMTQLDRVDFAFIDIEKHRYVEAFEAAEGRLSSGGLLAFHNAFVAEEQVRRIADRARSRGWAVSVIPTGEGLLVVKST